LALGPEGGSSYTFSKLFGRQKAFEYIVLGNSITSSQLAKDGLVNKVFTNEETMNVYVS
jgi:enoyl-CoA hydratase/carnithine racemase